MARQGVSNQSTAGHSSIMDDIGGFFSKIWHGITSFFSSLSGGDKSKSPATSATSSDDDSQADNTPASTRQTPTRGQRRGRKQDFTNAANNNTGSSMFPGANNGMSFASASTGAYLPQVARTSSPFNMNSSGGRESFSHGFASRGAGFQGGGMNFHGGGGMACHGGGRHGR